MRGLAAVLVVLPLSGCGAGEDTPVAPVTPAVAECGELELALPSGACFRPGIPPEGCADGFEHDGEYGCEPILPAESCPPGEMAVPGDSSCRAIMPCGAGPWGDIPVDGATVFVDASYRGTDSDGGIDSPWTSIGEAIAAATEGALIAVAAGVYAEDVKLGGKPLRLRGVCPELVEIVGSGMEDATVLIRSNADGSEIGGLAIRGPTWGIGISGSEDVLFDRLWIHDNGSAGINAPRDLGETSCVVRGSLIEGNHQIAVSSWGSTVTVEETVLRDTQSDGVNPLANGVYAQDHQPTRTRATVTVRRSLLERNRGVSLFVEGSDATVEAVVVRDTVLGGEQGRGIVIQDSEATGSRGSGLVRASLLERNVGQAISTAESDLTIESVVVRDTLPTPIGREGIGIVVDVSRGSAPVVVLKSSLLERNQDVGVQIQGSLATIDGSVVRDTLPGPDGFLGHGIAVVGSPDRSAGSTVVVRGSLVERSSTVGVSVFGADVTIESSIVRATAARPADGLFGDGISVFSLPVSARLTAVDVGVEQSARAGIAAFGAFVALASSAVACAAFDLEGEPHDGEAFAFEDRGGNFCGCPAARGPCVAVSAGLQPPDAPSP